jgi:hypothetical protein
MQSVHKYMCVENLKVKDELQGVFTYFACLQLPCLWRTDILICTPVIPERPI